MKPAETTILVVEDDSKICALLTQILRREGYQVLTATNKIHGLEKITSNFIHLVLLDWMLGSQDGIDFFRAVRAHNAHRDIPFIMLTARTSMEDQVYGLDQGIIDYICKPFQTPMLLARIRSCLLHNRRTSEHTITIGDYRLLVDRNQLIFRDSLITLSDTDCRLLASLMQKNGIPISRKRLLESITLSNQHIELRTVDVHISRLRKKLLAIDAGEVIQTVQRKGYMFITNFC